ncbi:hypothetical protein [Bartonella sp. CB178]
MNYAKVSYMLVSIAEVVEEDVLARLGALIYARLDRIFLRY